MTQSIKELILNRKSTRTFDGTPLNDEERDSIELYSQTLSNPFDVPIEFKLLDAKEHNLSSPVIIGANLYLAAKVTKVKNFEIGFGYSFEQACLFAESMGIGTGTLSRSTFEKAMQVKDNEVMPAVTPIGHPAPKRSIRETLMRKGIKADDRIPFEQLFFSYGFDKPLEKEEAGIYSDALESVRWAPSAANKQPWRVVVAGNKDHFYEKKTVKESSLGYVQKEDIGIALCHFDVTMQEAGYFGRFFEEDPKLPLPANTEYIVSYERIEERL